LIAPGRARIKKGLKNQFSNLPKIFLEDTQASDLKSNFQTIHLCSRLSYKFGLKRDDIYKRVIKIFLTGFGQL
jgi:hypothetical protein